VVAMHADARRRMRADDGKHQRIGALAADVVLAAHEKVALDTLALNLLEQQSRSHSKSPPQ